MEGRETTVSTLSDLIQRGCPLTATSSLVRSCEISSPERRKNSSQNRCGKSCFSTCQSPNTQTLKPLHEPTVLVGTLTLSSSVGSDSPISCSCFRFSDDSSTICCEILDFDPQMIGKKVRVLAWNFIPFKRKDRGAKGGFLEIIEWEFVHACSEDVCSLLDFSSVCFTLGICDFEGNSKSSSLIFGVIESISPVFVVSCANGGDGSTIRGFLVNVLVCRCKLCSSKLVVSDLKTLSEKNIKGHCFDETLILYFRGVTSSWHPVVSRFIGDIVLLTGLKKKLVFITKSESRLMYLTTDKVSLHVSMLFKKWGLTHNADTSEKGEGSYTGVITGMYMQGMVVELDQNVILLLTDQHLTVPHCVRVGAIVTIKHVHFVDPKFPWGKVLILGTCYRTSVYVKSFSPLETGCHLRAHSQSLLLKFIDSLSFSARLWALLVISSFRKKFTGILSDKEILGSKHMEGLAQKYATWYLPPSAFQFRGGVLVEFCKHDMCSRVRDGHYGHLGLVLPIADLISYCETSLKKNLEDEKTCLGFAGGINEKRPFSCGGRSYLQSIRKALRSEEIGLLLLGTLKISLTSGRLQLVDATGGLDIMLDHPVTWAFDRIFETKDFTLIMEGIPSKLVNLDSSICQPLSCRSIFCNSLPSRRMEASIYMHHSLTDGDSRSCSLFFGGKRNYQGLDSGKFHLLMLTHKFPVQRKFQGDLPKTSNMFAQAIVFPWDLLVTGKSQDAFTDMLSSAQHWIDSFKKFSGPEKFQTQKRCKIEQGSAEASSHGLKNPGYGLTVCCSSHKENSRVSNGLEFPCLIVRKGVNLHWVGMLHSANGDAKTDSDRKAPMQKVLLEFSPDSFCTYEALKIGYCYVVKHQEDDLLCSIRENYGIRQAKVFVSSKTHLWNVTLSSVESLKSDASDVLPYCNFHVSRNEVSPQECQQFEIPCMAYNGIDNDISSGYKVIVPSSTLNFLKNVFPTSSGDPVLPRDSVEEELDIPDHNGSMVNVLQQSSTNPCSDYPLPKGNLITLHGIVVAFHDVNGDAFPAPFRLTPGEGYMPKFLQGNGGVCIHVSVDNETVRIFHDKVKQNYPVGLGRGAYATFHRILAIGEQSSYHNSYMMIPVSFITISNTNLRNEQLGGEFNCSSGNIRPSNVADSPSTVPAALIYDAMQICELKPMQFRCRVVGIYVLVLEKARATSLFHSSGHSGPSVGIPFVGFFMDDGSSSCCCWTNSETAAAILRLDSTESLRKYPVETFGSTEAGTRLSHTSTVGNLDKILDHHGRIVVKNCGPLHDSSCQDLAFFVNSARLISISDEDLLRSMITNAIISTSWTIHASIINPETTSWLEERLAELDMAIPPLLNIWATSVSHTDILTAARNIIQGLI